MENNWANDFYKMQYKFIGNYPEGYHTKAANEILEQAGKPVESMLELGAWDGSLARALSNQVGQITTVELIKEMVEKAKSLNPDNIETVHGSFYNEEIFGPVLCVLPFDDVDEVIERGNLTEYGLSSGVHTKDINKAHKIINAIDAGTVWVNGYMNSDSNVPLGGFKQSGVGAEMGFPGIDIYTKSKSVVIDLDD